MNDEKTRSKDASSYDSASANPSSNRTFTPARAALRRARSSTRRSGSTPNTSIVASRCWMRTASVPVPHPTSSTRCPDASAAWSSSCSRKRWIPISRVNGSYSESGPWCPNAGMKV